MQQSNYCFNSAEFHQRFQFCKNIVLGTGYDSRVFLVQDKSNQKYYALKCLTNRDQYHLYNFRNEIQIYHVIKHPNIVEFFGYSQDFTTILLEYMPFGNLTKIISQNGMELPMAKAILNQLISAIQLLHSKNIVHGDLKPENALISSQCTIKLCDFGFARYLKSPETKLRGGSDGFTAPEVYTQVQYDCKKCDIFSLGIIFFILLLGYRPFLSNAPSKEDSLWAMIKSRNWEKFWIIFKPKKEIPIEFKEIFQQLIDPDPNQRMTIEQLAYVQWLQIDRASDQELVQFIQNKLAKVIV